MDIYLLCLVGIIALTNTLHIVFYYKDLAEKKRREKATQNFRSRMLLKDSPRVASVKKHISTTSTPVTSEGSERRRHG